MSKTSKYTLEIENIENVMLKPMELTQKEYTAQLKFLQQRVKETEFEDDENKIEMRKREYDFETYTEETYYFTNCCCDTILSRLVEK